MGASPPMDQLSAASQLRSGGAGLGGAGLGAVGPLGPAALRGAPPTAAKGSDGALLMDAEDAELIKELNKTIASLDRKTEQEASGKPSAVDGEPNGDKNDGRDAQ